MPLPTIVFDTSAVNRLAKDASHSEPLMVGLRHGFNVQVTGMVVSELISTPVSATRETLIACCQKLLSSGRCIWPPHEIIRLLVLAHAKNSALFNWQQLPVRATVYERAIIDRDFNDALCLEEWKVQQELEETFLNFWRALGSKLELVLADNPAMRPTSYAHAIEIASADGSVLWEVGKRLYSAVSGVSLSEADIKSFMDLCPPFRACCYALLGSWYDCSLKHPAPKRPAGRNDHMMAAYLPYCGRFVTRDKKQKTRLREVTVAARINCDVLYYDDFLASFEVVI